MGRILMPGLRGRRGVPPAWAASGLYSPAHVACAALLPMLEEAQTHRNCGTQMDETSHKRRRSDSRHIKTTQLRSSACNAKRRTRSTWSDERPPSQRAAGVDEIQHRRRRATPYPLMRRRSRTKSADPAQCQSAAEPEKVQDGERRTHTHARRIARALPRCTASRNAHDAPSQPTP